MSGRLRGNAVLAVNGALLVACFAWTAYGLVRVPAYPVLGWLPLPVMALLAADRCRRVGRISTLDAPTRRFWSHLSAVCVLLAVGVTSNAFDAMTGPEASQLISVQTMACYLIALALVMWALLRLPTWQRSRNDWVRFGLDACVILITSGVFVWHFSVRRLGDWESQTGSAAPLLAIALVAAVSVVTFVKVAFAGAGQLDRRALRLLGTATATAAVFGATTPFLVPYPHLSSTFTSVAIGAFIVHLATVAQARAGVEPVPQAPSRTISVLPYVAVAATDALLLLTSFREPEETPLIASSVVCLTVLVAVRQVVALRDNNRLLNTVDANLRQLRSYQEQLSHQATHDPLTGIANRALFERTVADLVGERTPFHMALLDLDDFKTVNDRLGHGMGDVLITTVSRRLVGHVRPRDTVARLGGDEFVVLLPDADADTVTRLITDLVTAVRTPVDLGGNAVATHASIGVTASRSDDRPEELLRRADVAMYAAKASGGDGFTWYDPEMDRQADAEARLTGELQQAISRDELFLVYQPIVELPDGRPSGVEALLRWRHPRHGLVPPDVFIPLAERTGDIIDIGRWVLVEACGQAAAWQRAASPGRPRKVSINMSARQLSQPGIVAEVADIVGRTGVDPSGLMIEVTETAVLAVDSAIDALRDLRALGLLIALDDFGTGNSSLSLLVNCPVDVLKVDKSFVSGVTSATSQAVIVDGLIDITNRLRIEAVAEGVETASQAERLHDAGYRYAQGFHYARPMTAPLVDTWLDEQVARTRAGQPELKPAGRRADGPDQPPGSTAEMRATSSSVLTGSTITS
jgi:diguanylate cyclase (GGDEF)-like protein